MKVDYVALSVVVILGGSFLLGLKELKESKVTIPSKPTQYDFSGAVTVDDLPIGTVPEDGDKIMIFYKDSDSVMGIDRDSWSLKDGIASFLVVSFPSDAEDVIVMKQRIDCKNNKYIEDYFVALDTDETILASDTKLGDWKPILQGSGAANLKKITCDPNGLPVPKKTESI